MIDLHFVWQQVRERIQEAPSYLILIYLGGAFFLLAQVVSRAS